MLTMPIPNFYGVPSSQGGSVTSKEVKSRAPLRKQKWITAK